MNGNTDLVNQLFGAVPLAGFLPSFDKLCFAVAGVFFAGSILALLLVCFNLDFIAWWKDDYQKSQAVKAEKMKAARAAAYRKHMARVYRYEAMRSQK